MTSLIETLVGRRDDQRWNRRYRARLRALPSAHRTAAEALERYTSRLGAMTTGDVPADRFIALLEAVVEPLERAAAAGAPVAAVLGHDPVRFADHLVETHLGGRWVDAGQDRATAVERQVHARIGREVAKERTRLLAAVGRAEQDRARLGAR